ncbi:MAG: 4Fe-4S dicluster domain-containing protein [Armatimonadota bacterium]|nr:4Fe-4S dicluster domain-containing protein [Armatimonadota bacterium]MDR7422273.1 4Fe-4S dicluster domain-containing protein [Armatimonadota bacterium]MDR7453776.1 4Fe-4S dicluster domain-containing protein [Armatimonadota bacterium]MDR7456304.1 4Fe-4S dicluster domain-containing protein [Armatimonadota bacterium]MDR7496301.1 4Fe-4S dicluster domain-containing protein [Armatimonadota bacterium]
MVGSAPPGVLVRWDGDEPVAEALRVVVAVERCKGCGLCVAVCPPAVLALGPLNARGYPAAILVDNDRCTSCTACALVCPECAIDVYRPPRAARRAAA